MNSNRASVNRAETGVFGRLGGTSGRAAWLAASCGLALSAGWAGADVQPSATMLRFPAVSDSRIAFVYANNIWTAPRSGGTATPVASPPGQALFPKFSPDGKTLAFVGNYDGNRDLYTVPLSGGAPTRITHHPGGESLSQWTQDNRLVFLTTGLGGLGRQSQLFTIGAEGGMPTKLPMPYAGFGTLSPDGEWAAFTPHSTDNRTWKRYRGGMATDVWVLNLKDRTSRKITDWEGTDTLPMFGFGREGSRTVYYLSDAGPEHRLNIWSFELGTSERKQLTNFADDDVRWPSIGPGAQEDRGGRGEIVFQLGSKLMLLDLNTRQSRAVTITIPGARPKVRERIVDASENMTDYSISPSGKRVAITARGDIWSVPAKEGPARNLTRTDGVFERGATWSPDGKWIAYFSDQSGEYELWVRPSDARPPAPKDDKEGEKDGEKKADAEKKDDGAKPDAGKAEAKSDAKPEAKPENVGPREPVKLTTIGAGFRKSIAWSPDSKHIVFTDHIGQVHLANIKIEGSAMTADTKVIDKDPWDENVALSWSSDSGWLAYARGDDDNANGVIWLYKLDTGEKTRVTSPMMAANSPAFDRKGEALFYVSSSEWTSPMYADADTTFVYAGTQRINMVPLRADVANPLVPKLDEEELKAEKKDDKAKKPADKPADKPGEKKNGAAADDGVSGTWSCTAQGVPNAPGPITFTLRLKVAEGGAVSGSMSSVMGEGTVSGTYDKSSNSMTLNFTAGQTSGTFTLTLKGTEMSGSWTGGGAGGSISGNRTAGPGAGDDKPDAEKKDADKDKPKPVKIDVQGIEQRAVRLPIPAGNYGGLGVSSDNKLIYVAGAARGVPGGPSIKIFDPKDDAKEEKVVVAGVGGYDMSADGKKLAIRRGNRIQIVDAAAGGGKAQDVPNTGLRTQIDPRSEWRQIFSDAWRLQRDYFYVDNMHGVDWGKMRSHYGALVEDAASREDVQYIIGELISELNIGHAYVQNPGDVDDSGPNLGVGLLGCDYELVKSDAGSAYKISRVYEGGSWETDARGPLSQATNPATGKPAKVGVGDFLLAVNGVPVDTSKDPWAAFVGLADRPAILTVSDKPVKDDTAREVVVRPVSSEGSLRFRAWIEANRKYVAEKTDGKVGYIYVPDTGVNGQNELFRQYFGQRDRAGLIIDERWNGGGQIPTRFIELLNRPVTNYWARRGFTDWTWPPDSAQGAKVMLINGLAGSGGDMFPWLFKANKIGKLIGMRTWGGLVGISGNPGFIDGGSMTVPTFGFYEKDGTWGVEGHGTDPDTFVLDDPGLMLDPAAGPDGAVRDPQLDAGIASVLDEIKQRPYARPARPASPDRKGMGIPDADK